MHRPNRPSAWQKKKKKWHHMDLTKQAGMSLPLQMETKFFHQWIFFHSLQTHNWPPQSTDLNPIMNLWGCAEE